DTAMSPETCFQLLGEKGVERDLDAFLDHVKAEYLPHAAIIDFTSSEQIAEQYPYWMRRGLHVITPNKKANTASMAHYTQLFSTARECRARYLYQTTVGGGLPILRTLRDLIRTGDEVREIQGVLSGTLSFLFNQYDGKRPFSELVAEGHRCGYTEPDPRDDLS